MLRPAERNLKILNCDFTEKKIHVSEYNIGLTTMNRGRESTVTILPILIGGKILAISSVCNY